MAFQVSDYHDLVRLIQEHPEWREELRHLLLTPELLDLPQAVRELVEAHKRAEERLTRLEQTVAELSETQRQLIEAQKHAEERLTRLEQTVAELAENQKRAEERLTRLEQTVAELAENQKRAEERLTRLEQTVAELSETQRQLIEAQKHAEERLTRLEQTVAELSENQKRAEERLTRLEQTVAELAENQKRAEERLTRLEQTVAELSETQRQLIEAQKHFEERLTRLEQIVAELVEGLRQLTEAQKKTEEKLQKLTERVDLISIQVDELRGDMLEIRYRQRAFSYFGRIISRAQVVDLQEIWADTVEPNLSEEERNDLLSLDLLIRGQLNRSWEELGGVKEIWLAVEVSGVVDQNDVKRAMRRAELLRKAGLVTLPVAAGREITKGANSLASEMGVILQKDGTLLYAEKAFERLRKT